MRGHPVSASPSAGRSDGWGPAALVLLAVALHARDLTIGFPDDDLRGLDTVFSTSLLALVRGGALPGGYTPVSRELYLWGWGKVMGLGALGFHLLGAAIAGVATVLVYRLGERWAGRCAGVIAAGVVWAFAPLGAMLSSALEARDLIALLFCAAALLLYTRGRWIPAGLAAGLAALSRETTLLVPVALLLADLLLAPRASPRERGARLAPAALAVAGAFGVMAWAGPQGPRAAASGAGVSGAAAVLLDFARAWAPAGTLAGLGATWRAAPWLVAGTAALALLTVPGGSVGAGHRGRPSAPSGRDPLVLLGLGTMLLGLLPVVFVRGPRPAEAFAVAALGMSLALGGWLARHSAWLARAALAAGALASLGANSVLPARDAAAAAGGVANGFTGHAFFRAQAARTAPVVEALRPLRAALAATPHTFAAGIPPDSTYRLALGPGARVTLRDPALSIRFLAEFTPRDAVEPFGVLRYDARRQRFVHERADARVRARIGEGMLLYARYEAAAACFAAAAAERPDDAELIYPRVVSLAAAGHAEEARARWREALDRGRFPLADTLAVRLLAGITGSGDDSARRATVRLAASVVADPAAAAPHLALGRHLLALGSARSATIEVAVACGVTGASQDLYWLARGYDALNAPAEAFEAYRVALAGGLDSTAYAHARRRFAELLRGRAGAGTFGAADRP